MSGPLTQPSEAVPVATSAGPRTVVAHRHPYPLRFCGDPDDDLGRVDRVPHGVGHRLLHDAVDRRVHSRGQRVQFAVERQVDPETTTRGAHQALQVGDTGRRRQFGAGPAVPQCGDHRTHFLQRARPLLLDPLQRLEGSGRVGARDHPAGLGADHHGRDVVGDRVMKFPGKSLALAGAHPRELPVASGRPDPHGRPDHTG
jgi:hypothetical protein